MVRSLRKSLAIRDEEKEVRIVPISEGHRIQAPHIREYDNHITLVNQGVKAAAPRIVKAISIPKVMPGLIRLPEFKPIITPIPADLAKDYDVYVHKTSIDNTPIGIWGVSKDYGLTTSTIHHVICPTCGRETGLIYGSDSPGEDFDLVTATVCFDCWKKYLRNGIMILTNDDPKRISPTGKVAIVPEREFYEYGRELFLPGVPKTGKAPELPVLNPNRVEVMDESYFMRLGLNGPGIPAGWGDKYIYKDWSHNNSFKKLKDEVTSDEVKIFSRGWFDKDAADAGLREFIIFKEPRNDNFIVGVTNMLDMFIKKLGREFPTLEKAEDYVKKLGGKL